jgi:hypothetical protein
MARITYVKAAQQRYETKPVIDPETGEQKRTPVIGRGGAQKISKRGPVFLRVTEDDHSRPKPNYVCEVCRGEIKVGQPYKHVSPKSGPYGGHKRVRCATCPTWQVWDLSNSLSARTAQIEHDFSEAISGATEEDDIRSALDDAVSSIDELAGEKRESAENIEQGFQHETEQSAELNSTADELEGWSQEIASFDIPEPPTAEDETCEECEGTGEIQPVEAEMDGTPEKDEPKPCDECDGSGHAEEVSEESYEEWRDTILSDCGIQNCPV